MIDSVTLNPKAVSLIISSSVKIAVKRRLQLFKKLSYHSGILWNFIPSETCKNPQTPIQLILLIDVDTIDFRLLITLGKIRKGLIKGHDPIYIVRIIFHIII